MTQRSLGFTLPRYTTAQLAAMVAAYGPAGTSAPNELQPGNLVYDTTLNAVVVFNGTAFVAVA